MAIANLSVALQDAVTLAQAAQFLPGKPHPATLWRWSTHGVRGTRLETWTVGGRRFTTLAALEKFLQLLNTAGPKAGVEHTELPLAESGRV